MARDSIWLNSDGLVVGYGPHTRDNDVAAVSGQGAVKTMVIELLDATALELNSAVTTASLPPQNALIPRGSYILEANFQVTEAFTTAAAGTLDIGTFATNATADLANGIDGAIAVTALDAVGAVVNCNGTLVGGIISCGATSTSDVVVGFSYETGVFTAGAGVLTLRYVEPQGTQGEDFAAVE